MACRRSGGRIPLAPPNLFSQLRGIVRRMQPHRQVSAGFRPYQSACSSLQVRAVFRVCRDLLRSRSRSHAGPSLTREFPPQIPRGSQPGSPRGRTDPTSPATTHARRTDSRNSPPEPMPKASEPVSAPCAPAPPAANWSTVSSHPGGGRLAETHRFRYPRRPCSYRPRTPHRGYAIFRDRPFGQRLLAEWSFHTPRQDRDGKLTSGPPPEWPPCVARLPLGTSA
jgi:hypothetical protein